MSSTNNNLHIRKETAVLCKSFRNYDQILVAVLVTIVIIININKSNNKHKK